MPSSISSTTLFGSLTALLIIFLPPKRKIELAGFTGKRRQIRNAVFANSLAPRSFAKSGDSAAVPAILPRAGHESPQTQHSPLNRHSPGGALPYANTRNRDADEAPSRAPKHRRKRREADISVSTNYT